MALLRELKFYFISWVVIFIAFAIITTFLGWGGFFGLWFGFGLINLVVNYRSLVGLEVPLLLVFVGPIELTAIISHKFDSQPERSENASHRDK